MNTIDRYICRNILRFTLISLLILLGLFMLINFLDQITLLGQGNYNIFGIIEYLVLRVPKLIYELFSMATLLGTIVGLSVLASDSELTVLRASGMSIFEIILAVLKTGGIFALVVMLIGELVIPFTETRAHRHRTEALQQDVGSKGAFGLWLRDSDSYVNVNEILPDLTLLGIKIIEFDKDRNLRSLMSAERGQYVDDYWQIHDVRQTLFSPDGNVDTVNIKAAQWQSRLSPQILAAFLINADQLSFTQLGHYIRHLKKNQQQATRYELAFWHKIMLPLSTAVMVILAVPFVFTNLRSGTLGRNVFIGIMLGIGFYAINQGFGYVVLAEGLPPLFGATFPVSIFLLMAILMIRRIE